MNYDNKVNIITEHIASYISIRDIGLLSQLSINRYKDDVSEADKMIKRSPIREKRT